MQHKTLKCSLKKIPPKYQLEYLRAYKKMIKATNEIKDFEFKTKEDQKKAKEILKSYRDSFTTISNINKILKNIL